MTGFGRRGRRLGLAVAAAVGCALTTAGGAFALVPLTRLGSDPFTNTTSQHRTEVEPDTFAYGSTIVAVAQAGRFFGGGASDNVWMTSTNGGTSWASGVLPGITKFAGAGAYDRASDPSIAFDVRHGVWLAASLALVESGGVRGVAVVVNRSGNGLTWSSPRTVATGTFLDKDWIVCDNHPASFFFGRCYVEFDDVSGGDKLKMSTSADGGLTWGVAKNTGDSANGFAGQPVVQANGTVIVPYLSADVSQIRSFRSVDGGASWRVTVPVASTFDHPVAGGLRAEPLPSAEVDAAGKVYVAWQSCRFRSSCTANDVVISTTTQGTYPTWTSPVRVPIDAVTSGRDHFIPGLAVNAGTSGSSAQLALTYYYYPAASCTSSTCQLDVGFVKSTNAGFTWSAPTQLAGPMALSWLASTSQGRMVGDYISTSFIAGTARGVFALATVPSGGFFNEAMFTTASGF
jgi:hypothetical protein